MMMIMNAYSIVSHVVHVDAYRRSGTLLNVIALLFGKRGEGVLLRGTLLRLIELDREHQLMIFACGIEQV
jgi:hypothetical protein